MYNTNNAETINAVTHPVTRLFQVSSGICEQYRKWVEI